MATAGPHVAGGELDHGLGRARARRVAGVLDDTAGGAVLLGEPGLRWSSLARERPVELATASCSVAGGLDQRSCRSDRLDRRSARAASRDDAELAARGGERPDGEVDVASRLAPPTSACGCAPCPSARPGRRSRRHRRRAGRAPAAIACASFASCSITGMIGVSPGRSSKPAACHPAAEALTSLHQMRAPVVGRLRDSRSPSARRRQPAGRASWRRGRAARAGAACR